MKKTLQSNSIASSASTQTTSVSSSRRRKHNNTARAAVLCGGFLLLSMIINPIFSFNNNLLGSRRIIGTFSTTLSLNVEEQPPSSATTTTTPSVEVEEEATMEMINGGPGEEAEALKDNDDQIIEEEKSEIEVLAKITTNGEATMEAEEELDRKSDSIDDIPADIMIAKISSNENDNDDEETELLVSDISPLAPPLTFQKFMTMQNKRVPVQIRYSAESGMKPYFLTVAKKIKENHPDVILNKIVLPKEEGSGGEGDVVGSNPTFEVVVDGKVVIRGPSGNRSGRSKTAGAMSIFVSGEELDQAISRARKRRRPATVYGEDGKNVRLEMLKTKAKSHRHYND